MNRVEQVEQLMEAFARRTGLVGDAAPRRYLWTDAFAVCNDLSLYRARGDDAFLTRARGLVTQVHDVLGAYAENDCRSGWLGGMDDAGHSDSPTRAGLRIGKPMAERRPGEPRDEREEWERDGQYFHYLTRWMHALQRMAEVTGEPRYHRWAVELSVAAFEGFVERSAGGLRMYWKMSVDLDRPLVSSMGQHDPLDGWVTALALAGSKFADEAQRRKLFQQASVYRRMLAQGDIVSADPLGIGGLLVDAWQLFRTFPRPTCDVDDGSIAALVEAASAGLEYFQRRRELDVPASRRLGFRELGLCIGIRAAQRLSECSLKNGPLEASLRRIGSDFAIADLIERTWLDPQNQGFRAWTEHRDINEVMLATGLAPDGYLGPAPEGKIDKEVSS